MQTLSPSNFQTLSGPIYLELREQLITGIFEPGQRLKLNELAEQTGTSVSPVREALIRLVAEDSVEMSSLRAFAVPNLSAARFEQIVAMRLALEGLAAERAAGQVSQVDLKKLSGLHDRFIEAEQGGHRSKAQVLNRSFHFLVYECAKMPILLSSISMLWAISQVVEIDEWEKEDISNLLGITILEVEEIFEEAQDEYDAIEDSFEEYNSFEEYEDL